VVNKANLTVSAENKERYYGDANPELTYTFAGFVNGDSRADLQTLPKVACSAAPISPAGNYPITVSGADDKNYNFFYQQAQLTVNKAVLTVNSNDVSRKYGDNNPAFVLGYSGFKNNETESILTEKPVAITNAKATSAVGVYDIFVSGGSAINYDFSYLSGKLTIEKALLTIIAEDKQRKQGEDNPPFTLLYSGFKNNENQSVLDVLPNLYCAANINSLVGFYDIVLSGGSDNNYSYTLINGKLEVTSPTSLAEINAPKVSLYPNPAKHYLFIKSDSPIKKTEIYNQSGICVLINDKVMEKLDISGLTNGVYLVSIYTDGGVATKKIVIKK